MESISLPTRPPGGGRRRAHEAAAWLLKEYVHAVDDALRAEGLSVWETTIGPGPDLTAAMTLTTATGSATAGPAAGFDAVSGVGRDGMPGRVELVWSEDTGWCLSHHPLGTPAAPWRYLHIELAPAPATVARFVAAALRDREDVGMLYPARFRFRGQPIAPVVDALTRALARTRNTTRGEPALEPRGGELLDVGC